MKGKTTHSKPTVSVDTFRDDPLYPRIARAAEQILARGKIVAPIDVLVRMHVLAPERLEDWRRARVPFHPPPSSAEERPDGDVPGREAADNR